MTKIEVVCRRCGRRAPADEFKVDHVYKLAVCRVCYTERQKQESKKSESSSKDEKTSVLNDVSSKTNTPKLDDKTKIEKSKIFDEDEDDKYLKKEFEKKQERLKQERENVVRVKKLSSNKVLYPCQNCGYKFKFNIETQRPLDCPFCGKKINTNIVF